MVFLPSFQLMLTVMLLTIIVYIYTVIAFNFFRKFYVQEEDDQVDQKCHDMLTVSSCSFSLQKLGMRSPVRNDVFLLHFQCFVFHLYKGVRAGGGIGDEIEPPDGDDYEVYRIFFDITFFFFVIVILLAIIQGTTDLRRLDWHLNHYVPAICDVYLFQVWLSTHLVSWETSWRAWKRTWSPIASFAGLGRTFWTLFLMDSTLTWWRNIIWRTTCT